jgi:hypothetical protein
MNLSFGLSRAIPPGVSCAWGARFIYPDDLLWDRQDFVGEGDEKAALINWLNPGPGQGAAIQKAKDAARKADQKWKLSRDGDQEVILHQDDKGVVVACPNKSHGYLYVAAWLHYEEADKQPAASFEALDLEDPFAKLKADAEAFDPDFEDDDEPGVWER